MRKFGLLKSLLVVSIPVLGLTAVSCNKNQGAAQAPGGVQSFPVVEVIKKDLTAYYEYPTNIEGIKDIAIRAKIDGYIDQIYIDEGEKVDKGQLLFKLETQSLSQQADAAKAQISVAEANVNVAKVEAEKLRPLVEKGIIAKVQLETAEANLAAARSQLAQAKSNYGSVAENVDYTRIKSPVSGVVGALPYKAGTLVGRSEALPLTTVSDISKVYAYFSMNEKDFMDFTARLEGRNLPEKLKKLPKVQLLLANGESYEHEGSVETTTGSIDPSTGTITFRAIFPNPEGIIRSGSSGTVKIPRPLQDVLVVPAQSTYDMQGMRYVFKVGGGDTAHAARIEVPLQVDNYLVVEEGLKEGDKIVAQGVGKVQDGMPIKPQILPLDSVANSVNVVFK